MLSKYNKAWAAAAAGLLVAAIQAAMVLGYLTAELAASLTAIVGIIVGPAAVYQTPNAGMVDADALKRAAPDGNAARAIETAVDLMMRKR